MSDVIITEASLDALREKVRPYMKESRYVHALGVESECEALGELLLPDRKMKLRAAALLHDITKRLTPDEQKKFCDENGISYDKSYLMSPALFHAKTGAYVAKRDFPEFTDGEILSAIRYHTTGRRGMTLFESIVYLADYIEPNRTFDNCVSLRKFFWDGISSGADAEKTFRLAMIKSFDMTISDALTDGTVLDPDTTDARNYYIEINREKTYEI